MEFLAMIVFVIILNIGFFGLRVWSRRIAAVPSGWDDYLILPSLLVNLGMCIIAIGGYHLPLSCVMNTKTVSSLRRESVQQLTT